MEVYIVLRKSLLRLDVDELLNAEKAPIPQRIVEFIGSGLPIGMGAFVLDSDLYFAGGEMLKKDVILDNGFNSSLVLDESYGGNWPGLSSKVFLFQPSSSSPVPFTLEHNISHMNQPKTKSVAATFEGKIYIISAYPYIQRDCDFFYPPPFECYDPVTNSWEVLPEPPHFSNKRYSHYIQHLFVSGSKIYLKSPSGIHFFDIRARQWYDYKAICAQLQNVSVCDKWISVAEGDGGIAVAYTLGDRLVGYECGSDLATTIKRKQLLDKINEKLPSHGDCYEGFVNHLGANRFCFIVSTDDDVSVWSVHIIIFEVVRTRDGGQGFLETTILCSHYYDFVPLTSWDHVRIQDVVFMSKQGNQRSKKRTIEEMNEENVVVS